MIWQMDGEGSKKTRKEIALVFMQQHSCTEAAAKILITPPVISEDEEEEMISPNTKISILSSSLKILGMNLCHLCVC